MRSLRSSVVVLLLLVAAGAAPSEDSTLVADSPEAALVVILSRYFGGEQGGNGFVVGDGTLVVTNDHIVYQNSEKGDHRMEGFVAVHSPYLGRACSARILAVDEKLDLAVLEVPWRGHPSFSVADVNAIKVAEVARVVGLPAIVKYMENPSSGAIAPDVLAVRDEQLPVAAGRFGETVPPSVFLKGVGELGRGWSGSPMFVPGTSQAIGCFGRITRISKSAETAMWSANGPPLCHVPRLLGLDLDHKRLEPVGTPVESPDDADEAFSLALRASSFLRPGQYEPAPELARAFIQLRPHSALGHKMLAYASERLGRIDTAREFYRHALKLDPNGLNGQLLYAQFSGSHGDPNVAEQILESLWQSGRSPDLVAIAMVNHFGEQGKFDRCLAVLDEAVKLRPRNAYLWYQLAACRMQAGGPQAMIEPLTHAVELYPERGPWRGGLARLLERTGALDQAEAHFRVLLEIEPENSVVYCWLAGFLHQHRPHAAQEALAMAQKALDMPRARSLPPEKIQSLIRKIRSRILPAEPNEPAGLSSH